MSTYEETNANVPLTIFQYHKFQLKGKPPALNSTQPLTLFYHAEEKLRKAIAALKRINPAFTLNLPGKLARIHKAQRLLLDTIYLIYVEADENIKASREYRTSLPPEDQMELENNFSENILYAAQAISKGYRIRGIESFTNELKGPANVLCASFETLRCVFKLRIYKDSRPPYRDLDSILKDFDSAWVDFEKSICFAYFSLSSFGKPFCTQEIELFQILLSETILYCLSHKYLTREDLENCEPSTFITIPRMSIMVAIVRRPEILPSTSEHPSRLFHWFKEKSSLLQDISSELSLLDESELNHLEKLLANQENECITQESMLILFRSICIVVDDLQSGPRAKEFNLLMSRVFSMYSSL